MKRIISLFTLLVVVLAAHAQDDVTSQAEEAAKKAREAAAAAAEVRKKITVNGRETNISEDFIRVVKQQQAEKEANKLRKMHIQNGDSTKWVRNQYKLHNYPQTWFAGGNLVSNILVADNITDHPPFRYFSDAVGLGVEGYVGKYFSRSFAARAGVGFHNTKNRVDYETVDQAWLGNPPLYAGHGYYRFLTTEVFADAMFDVSGSARSARFHPLHVHVVLGVAMVASGSKKLKGHWLIDPVEETENHMIKGHENAASFQNRVKPGSHVSLAGRAGLNFDYRVSKNMAVDMELLGTVTDDSYEGIKYDEPFDIIMKVSLGARYYF